MVSTPISRRSLLRSLGGATALAVAQRVALFELGTWNYMTAGRNQYLERVKSRYGHRGTMLRVPFASGGSLQGNPMKMDAAEALALTRWRSRIAEPTRRNVAARLLQDGEYLYLQLEEQCGPEHLQSTDDVVGGDYWQVLYGSQAGIST